MVRVDHLGTTRDLNRVDRLLKRNRTGTITEPERGELEKYLRVGNLIDLMRARALREIRQSTAE